LALLAALLLPACAGGPVARPEFKDIPPVAGSFAQQLVTLRKVDGLSLKVYNTGSVIAPGASVSSIKSSAARTRLDIPVFLVKHPNKGYLLFDTGLHPDLERMPANKMSRFDASFLPFKMAPGQNIVSQLKADGIDPAEVKTVILSSLRMDHAGMVEGFPGAAVYVDRREWEAQKKKVLEKPAPYQFDPLSMEARMRLRQVDLSSAPVYASFDHAEDLFRDGTVLLVDLSGFAAGGVGLWVSLDSGPVLLAGDASWVLDNHQDLALPRAAYVVDLLRYWRRLYQMQEAQHAVERLVIFPGHDLMPLRLQPRPDVSAVPFPR
jgi:glyoxylase-like metal-dependent hydrolase (beta-lactamase superfamily II)